MFFNIARDLFKSIEVLSRSGKVQIGSKGRKNYRSRLSEIEVLNTLSDFALKKLSLYSLGKSVFNLAKDLFTSIEGLSRSGKVQIGSKGRKKYRSRMSEIEVLNTLSDFALKILSLYSLTKSVFQYSEGLIQIN